VFLRWNIGFFDRGTLETSQNIRAAQAILHNLE
jgi:hypothetical protein